MSFPHLVLARLYEHLEPIDRGNRYEDPLQEALAAATLGQVTGGGTQMGADGGIAYADIEIELANLDGAVQTVADVVTLTTVPHERADGTTSTPRQDDKLTDLRKALEAVAAQGREINSRRLGNFIAKHERRVEAGMRFERAGDRSGVVLWRVVTVDALAPDDSQEWPIDEGAGPRVARLSRRQVWERHADRVLKISAGR